MRRWEARCPECTCVSMKPGATSRPRASISVSTAPSKRKPTCRTRSFSYTTTPSGMSVWVLPAKPITHPPRTRVLISGSGRALDSRRSSLCGRGRTRQRGHRARPLTLPSPPMGERDKNDALDAESGGTDPARLRDVDHDAVGAVVLHLDVAVLVLPIADSEGLVDVMARLRARRGQPLGDGLEAFDLEADVMDTAEALAALDSGHRVVLEIQDGQIEVAVAEIVAAGVGAVDLADLLHPEHVDVELGGLVHVLGRQRDVLDLGHEISPVGMSFPLSGYVHPR